MNTDKDFKSEIMDEIINLDINKLINKYYHNCDNIHVLLALHELMKENEILESYKSHWPGYSVIAMIFHFKISLGHTDSYTVLTEVSKRHHSMIKYFTRDEVLDLGLTPYYENRDLHYNPFRKT